MKVCKKGFSILLIMVLCFTMIFMDCGVVNAETARGKVKEIKDLLPSSYTIKENTEGQWSLDENGEYYYRYNTNILEQKSFVAVYENGEEITYSYYGGAGDPYWSLYHYRGSDGSEVRVYNPIRSNQEEKHFTVDSDNSFIFQFEGASVKIPVEITKNLKETTIKEIQYEPVIKEVDYAHCYIGYNAEKEEMQWIFPNNYCFNDGDKLTIADTTGKETIYTYKYDTNDDYRFRTEEGIVLDGELAVSHDQDLNKWESGKECYYIVEYGGAITKVPITIKENDIESISLFVEADSEERKIDCDADIEKKIDGIVVHKTDGTEEIIKYREDYFISDSQGGQHLTGFFDENDSYIEDISIIHKNRKESGQWYVYYHGVSCEIPTAHKFTNYTYNNDATVGKDGTETAICDNGCGEKNTRTKAGTALSGGGSSGGGIYIPPVQNLEISSGEGYTTELSDDGKNAEIIVDEDYELVDVSVNGISKGSVATLEGLKTGDKVVITVISKVEKIQNQLKNVTKENLRAHSKQVKLKNGKKAVKITWTNTSGIDFDGVEIFRSFKRYEGFGTKPIFSTEKEQYYNTTVKKGVKYYYKVRGYIEYKGIKYYSDCSTKAWRTVK